MNYLLYLSLVYIVSLTSAYYFEVNSTFDHDQPAFVSFPLRGSPSHKLMGIGVSAYMDHRHVIRGITKEPHVALNTVMPCATNQTLLSNVKCLFYNQRKKYVYYSTSQTNRFIHETTLLSFMTSVVSKCFVSAEDYRLHPPDFVTMVYSSPNNTQAAVDHITTDTQWLKVQNQQVPTYSDLVNTNSSHSVEKPRAALCSAPLRGDLYAQSIYEWLVYNVEVMHFSRIILYNNELGNVTVAVIKQVSQYYAARNVSIELHTWRYPKSCHDMPILFARNVSCPKRLMHYFGQQSQEQDCHHRALQTHRWIAFFDVDEYFDIHPNSSTKNVPDIIHHGLQINPQMSLFHFSNVFFSVNCTTINETLNYSLVQLEKTFSVPRAMMPATYSILRSSKNSKPYSRSKLIADGLFLVNTFIHHAVFEDFDTKKNGSCNRIYRLSPVQEGILHHVRQEPTSCRGPLKTAELLHMDQEQSWIFDQYGSFLASRIADILRV